MPQPTGRRAPARAPIPGSPELLAIQDWLLDAVPAYDPGTRRYPRRRVLREWRQFGAARMPLGARFSAVRMPAGLLTALTGATDPRRVGDLLADRHRLTGPVVYDPRSRRYYALVSPTVPRTWHTGLPPGAAEEDVDVLGRGAWLDVPPVWVAGPGPRPAPWWVVPMPGPGVLCQSSAVARLVADARYALEGGAP